jgi:hypothetical protein
LRPEFGLDRAPNRSYHSTRAAIEADVDRFDKFTDEARRVLTYAQDEAQRLDHNYIGTEHFLLGLVREEESVAAHVLKAMGIGLPDVRRAVLFIVGRGDRPVPGEVGLTPRAKRVIELAIDEARRLGHRYIGTEHLLLGLVREGEGVAAGVLESMGVDLDRVRREVIRAVTTGVTPQPTEPAEDAPISHRVDIESGALERVIAIGRVEVHPGVSLELIALEVRAAGSLLHWKADFDGQPVRLGPELRARDDLGTVYQARPLSWSRSGRVARGQIAIVPSPPADAAVLALQFRVSAAPLENDSSEAFLLFEVGLKG